jgi:hypothetical protein
MLVASALAMSVSNGTGPMPELGPAPRPRARRTFVPEPKEPETPEDLQRIEAAFARQERKLKARRENRERSAK